MTQSIALAELAEGLAAALRAMDGKSLSYDAAIDLLIARGATPKGAAEAIAHGIDEGLLHAGAEGLRAG